MPVGSHLYAGKLLRHLRDALVIRGDDDFAEGFGQPTSLDNMLKQRLARYEMQRFAGKTRRGITSRDDAEDSHGWIYDNPAVNARTNNGRLQATVPARINAPSISNPVLPASAEFPACAHGGSGSRV